MTIWGLVHKDLLLKLLKLLTALVKRLPMAWVLAIIRMLVHEIKILTLSSVEIWFANLLLRRLCLVKQLLLVKLQTAKLTLGDFNFTF